MALSIILVIVSTSAFLFFALDQNNLINISPKADAYVVADLNDPSDALGLRTLNTGDYSFLKIWYAWNVSGSLNAQIVSLAYMRFDLSGIKQDEVVNAKLALWGQNITLTGASRIVNLHSSSGPWEESKINYINSPIFSDEIVASSSISHNGWYEWEITEFIKESTGNEITFAIMFETIINGNEEQVVFLSKETSDQSLRPKIIVESSLPKGLLSDLDQQITAIVAIIGFAIVILSYYFDRKNGRPTAKIKKSKCPNCGKDITKDYVVCPFCKYDLKKLKCPNCGKKISEDFQACPYCGKTLR